MLKGKRALIVGIASNRSIANGIAEVFHQFGAQLAFTYQNERFKSRVEETANSLGSKIILPCDVSDDQQISDLFLNLKEHWQTFDILIHSVAYAPANQLQGDYVSVIDRESFRIAHDISSYSFTALAKSSMNMMNPNGALLTLTYMGAEKVVPNYNVMGLAKASLEANIRYLANSLGTRQIRVNGISAGVIKTLAASGIKDLKKMLTYSEQISPIKSTLTTEQVGNVAAFLCSDLASAVTGEIIHVDNGLHSIAIPAL